MDKIDSIKPIDVRNAETQAAKGQPQKNDEPKADDAAIVNDTRPALEAAEAASLAGSLSARVDKSPDAAIGALGNFDEARIRALLGDE